MCLVGEFCTVVQSELTASTGKKFGDHRLSAEGYCSRVVGPTTLLTANQELTREEFNTEKGEDR
jgi:hypothetical protein